MKIYLVVKVNMLGPEEVLSAHTDEIEALREANETVWRKVVPIELNGYGKPPAQLILDTSEVSSHWQRVLADYRTWLARCNPDQPEWGMCLVKLDSLVRGGTIPDNGSQEPLPEKEK